MHVHHLTPTRTPRFSRAGPTLVLADLQKRCDDHDRPYFGKEKHCKECAKIKYCVSKLDVGTIFNSCSCAFDERKAKAALKTHRVALDERALAQERSSLQIMHDPKVWAVTLLHKIHLDMKLTTDEAAEFVAFQSSILTLIVLPNSAIDNFAVRKILKVKEACATRKRWLEKYMAAIKGDSRGIIPDAMKTDEKTVLLLAHSLLDSLLFAGGLSVPSIINVGMAVLYSDSSPLEAKSRDLTRETVTPFVFEIARRYPAVVGFPYWVPHKDGDKELSKKHQETKDKHYVLNLAMSLRDPRKWGADADDFKLRDIKQYHKLMGTAWAQQANGPGNRKTTANKLTSASRGCPGQDLSMAMATSWFTVVAKDQAKWRVAQKPKQGIKLTETTPFVNGDFKLMKKDFIDVNACDEGKCELYEIDSLQVDKEMAGADGYHGVPENLQGLFWMEGNPASDEVASFGASPWTFSDGLLGEHAVDASIPVYGNSMWSWHADSHGKTAFKLVSKVRLHYHFKCNSAVDHCDIAIESNVAGIKVGVPGFVASFSMTMCTDDNKDLPHMAKCLSDSTGDKGEAMWIRHSALGKGIIKHQYMLRRIVFNSKRLPKSWARYAKNVAPKSMLARPVDEIRPAKAFQASANAQDMDSAIQMFSGIKDGTLDSINPGENGCTENTDCVATRKCDMTGDKGRCRALAGQLGKSRVCRTDEECKSGECDGNRWGYRDGKCTGKHEGVRQVPVEDKCKVKHNPASCGACAGAQNTDGGDCAWCYAYRYDSKGGACVKGAAHCPRGSLYFASKSKQPQMSDDDNTSDEGVPFQTGAEVVPFNRTHPETCPPEDASTNRFEALKPYFPAGPGFTKNIEKMLETRYFKMDFFSRTNYWAGLMGSFSEWLDDLPTATKSAKTFEEPSAFTDKRSEFADMGFITISKHDEDWPDQTAMGRFAVKAITKLPGGFGRMGKHNWLVIPRKKPFYPLTNWEEDWGAKAHIFQQNRSAAWKNKAIDAETKCMIDEYFGHVLPQPLAKWTAEQLASDQGITDMMFYGQGVVFLRAIRSTASKTPAVGNQRFRATAASSLLAKKTGKKSRAKKMAAELASELSLGKGDVGDAVPADAKYEVDLRMLQGLSMKPGILPYGARAMFKEDGHCLSIWTPHTLTQKPGGKRWEEAKWALKATILMQITATNHLLYSHLTVSNGVAQAAQDHLGANHPLRILLKPFTYRANAINSQAAQALFIENGLVDRIFGFDRKGVEDAFKAMAKAWKYEPIPQWIDNAGVRDLKLPVHTDSQKLWDIFKTFAAEYVEMVYPGGKGLAEDKKLKNYWHHVENSRSTERVTMKFGLPNEITSENLSDQLAHMMFWVTGMHKVVGNIADWIREGGRSMSAVIRPGELQADYQSMFNMNTLAGFTGMPQINLINDWTHLFKGKKARAILDKWQGALRKRADEVEADNLKRKFPNNYLNPRHLDSSIAI